ncbi:MAG: hypothetical protein HY597_06285 [Candidatus Omnitrophica bacterium]|nr:hypothetical protein [Candidatus Omnitrophota bacterium]
MADRYFDLQRNRSTSATGYLTQCLLESRLQMGLPSAGEACDEDVTVYLAHLLASITDPQFLSLCEQYVSPRDQDVFHAAEQAKDDLYLKYLLYRTNADHLLVSLGLFHNLGNASPHWFVRDRGCHTGHGKTYYQFAATYHRQLSHKLSATSAVLGKLSSRFEIYSDLLTHTRETYFQFRERTTTADVDRLLGDVDLQQLQDELLDCYSAWLKSPTPDLKERLGALVQALSRRDPEFRRDTFPL